MAGVTNIRIKNVNIPKHKHIVIGLTEIYGIGKSTAQKICEATQIAPTKRVEDLSEADVELLRTEVDKYETEGDLRRKVAMSIKRLVDLKCFRGVRLRKGLPVRGQRTKTNAQTARKRVKKKA